MITKSIEYFQYFHNPIIQWQLMPTFLVGEYLFYVLALIAFLHAKRHGFAHMLIWYASVVSGTANDLFFIFLPFVDNFWQAQATIMLTPRFPLYIACVYICFMYFSVVAVWRTSLGMLGRAALAGLLAYFFYAPYDIIGVKYLWWTWHQTDPSVQERLLNVPVGSSMWVMTFVFSFFILLNIGINKISGSHIKKTCVTLLICFLFTTPFMLVQMTLIQLFNQQHIPTLAGFLILFAIYILIITIDIFYKYSKSYFYSILPNQSDRMLKITIFIYYFILFILVIFLKPEYHISTGVHQTYGPCNLTGTDLAGHIRKLYFCNEDRNPNFVVHSLKDYTSWYSIQGTPHIYSLYWYSDLILISLLGYFLFYILFSKKRPTNRIIL